VGRPRKRRALGRREPTDFEHVAKWPLTLATTPAAATPVILGIQWYESFYTPEKLATRWWIGRGNDWGPVAGGHAIVAKPVGLSDLYSWWRYYDQKSEGSCVGFSESRAVSFMNRERYDSRWLYQEAKKVDEWEGEAYDGTSVRAGLRVLVEQGHRRVVAGVSRPPDLIRGISHYRWATTVEGVVQALSEADDDDGMNDIEAIPLHNSWGTTFPMKVWLPFKALERLLAENGEAAIMTDR
jgi:hypothetical protein